MTMDDSSDDDSGESASRSLLREVTDVSEEQQHHADSDAPVRDRELPATAEGFPTLKTPPRARSIETYDETNSSAPRPVESMREGGSDIPTLVCLTGARAGETTTLNAESTLLGRDRDQVDIWFSDRAVSRVHAVVERVEQGSFRIRDLDSSNGTYVNQKRVRTSRRLEAGDKLVLSKEAILKFATPDSLERNFHDRVYESAVRDELTDANTRAYLEEQMRSEVGLVQRYSGQFQSALLLLDIDHFKEVNDTHGHPVGDAALKAFSDLCKSLIRTEDVFARYGGEEFAVLLRLTDEESVETVAERIRKGVESNGLRVDDLMIQKTVSIGGACYDPLRVDDVRGWFERADQALYAAKDAGRNRTRMYGEDGAT